MGADWVMSRAFAASGMPNGLGGVGGVPLADPSRHWAQRGWLSPPFFHQEEEPLGPSPDMPATAEPSSSETDKEVLSPVVAATATSFSMGEEPGPDRAITPPVWERGGLRGAQQGAFPVPDSGQPCPGPSFGLTSTVSGTSEDLRPPRRRPLPGKQIPCSSPGCCLSFPSIRDLAQHLRTHCPPTQSLEGKLFRCSALSCTETFPSMQELVAHSKLHYKPNRYFKCENCLLRFRTHRSLFKHLHVCAEHAQSPAPPPPPALDKEPLALERPPECDPALAPGLQFPLLEPFTTPAPAPAGPFLPYLNPAPFGLSPPRLRTFLATAPGPPASSAAVWKKSQGAGGSPRRPQGGSDAPSGHAAPSRIVWEHTRGRYSCMQCAFSTASRPAMTLHLEDHRPVAPVAPASGQPRPDPDARADPAPLAPKVSPLLSEGECPGFSPP
ncbi:PREDICTED: zinc finger protein 414 isoform X2 [Hipposideros armiger]|uniref:Zinc finger protein 414 isoform X2 n=1 Tax=Hipposideros armiger TaxID=186990 RepID=A0A8B7TBR9_HIPAR|nr:PREDICTED: zinc finger protein 414 isoform X2 [Hipposideros armiger]